MLAAPPSHLERRIIAMRTRLTRPRPLHLAGAGALLVLAVAGACSEGAPNRPIAQKSVQAKTPSMAAPTKTEEPYFEFQVENPAQQIAKSGYPKYPPAMREARREGEVLAQFVVDKEGAADLTTFKVLKSPDAAFTDAVREALPRMRFTPARIGGAAVSQLVQQPFTFALSSAK
jgi:TonB family protein